MTKLHTFLSLAVLAITLGGCELYFGDKNGGDKSSYCDSTGYYECTGGACQLVSQTCPAGGTGGPCKANSDCAAGCACQVDPGAEGGGTCVENGFCTTPADCPDGMTCDDRSSCVDGCSDSNPCAKGQVCNPDTRTCEGDPESCVAPNNSTCTALPPSCAEHQVPTTGADGCFSGKCRDISACNEDAACTIIQHEDDCLTANTRCSASYTGINCHKTDGTACKAGDVGCTCDSFVYARCLDRNASGRQVTPDGNGGYISINGN